MKEIPKELYSFNYKKYNISNMLLNKNNISQSCNIKPKQTYINNYQNYTNNSLNKINNLYNEISKKSNLKRLKLDNTGLLNINNSILSNFNTAKTKNYNEYNSNYKTTHSIKDNNKNNNNNKLLYDKTSDKLILDLNTKKNNKYNNKYYFDINKTRNNSYDFNRHLTTIDSNFKYLNIDKNNNNNKNEYRYQLNEFKSTIRNKSMFNNNVIEKKINLSLKDYNKFTSFSKDNYNNNKNLQKDTLFKNSNIKEKIQSILNDNYIQRDKSKNFEEFLKKENMINKYIPSKNILLNKSSSNTKSINNISELSYNLNKNNINCKESSTLKERLNKRSSFLKEYNIDYKINNNLNSVNDVNIKKYYNNFFESNVNIDNKNSFLFKTYKNSKHISCSINNENNVFTSNIADKLINSSSFLNNDTSSYNIDNKKCRNRNYNPLCIKTSINCDSKLFNVDNISSNCYSNILKNNQKTIKKPPLCPTKRNKDSFNMNYNLNNISKSRQPKLKENFIYHINNKNNFLNSRENSTLSIKKNISFVSNYNNSFSNNNTNKSIIINKSLSENVENNLKDLTLKNKIDLNKQTKSRSNSLYLNANNRNEKNRKSIIFSQYNSNWLNNITKDKKIENNM